MNEKIILNTVMTYSWECPKCGRVNHESIDYTDIETKVMCEGCCKSFEIEKINN